jgi:ABC-type sugar transport system permease subunit
MQRVRGDSTRYADLRHIGDRPDRDEVVSSIEDDLARMSSPTPPIQNGSGPAAGYRAGGNLRRLSRETIQRIVVLGFITAVAMPPVGLVLGLLLALRLDRPHSKRGLWVIAVSIIAAILWFVTLATGIVNPNSNTST